MIQNSNSAETLPALVKDHDRKFHRIAIAPMMDITYESFRIMFRYLTKYSVLYTEMIHEKSIHFNKNVLRYSQIEHPVVCQLGGNNPFKLAVAAKICEELGYDEVNLNVGCPSERVQDGAFGACLMKEPELVAEIMKTMREAVKIPVTIKCRLGVDNLDTYEFIKGFVETVSSGSGITHFVIHARKAFLKGLNPAANRSVPPLRYDFVVQLKNDFPHLDFSINGGIKTVEQIDELLDQGLQGCMIGRAAYENPWMFSDADRRYYGVPNQNYSRKEVLQLYAKDIDALREQDNFRASYPMLVKPIIHLFTHEKKNKFYRHFLSNTDNHKKYKIFSEIVEQAIIVLEKLNSEALNRRPNDQFINPIVQDIKAQDQNDLEDELEIEMQKD